jgi:hypothetical protein
MGYFGSARAKIREINDRYREPRIALRGSTKVVLMALRVYLLVLVGLLLYALVTHAR